MAKKIFFYWLLFKKRRPNQSVVTNFNKYTKERKKERKQEASVKKVTIQGKTISDATPQKLLNNDIYEL